MAISMNSDVMFFNGPSF